jgi:hypothetical protein
MCPYLRGMVNVSGLVKNLRAEVTVKPRTVAASKDVPLLWTLNPAAGG